MRKLLKKTLPSLADVQKQREAALQDDRQLSEEESELLTHVLSHGSESANSFLAQVPFAKVIGHCACGCPTINLQVNKSASLGYTDARVIVDLTGRTSDDKLVGLLVFADKGYLSSLEVYDLDELARPYSLPLLNSLRTFEDDKPLTPAVKSHG